MRRFADRTRRHIPEVLNRVQQLVNRENESITKQVLLNVNVLSVALSPTSRSEAQTSNNSSLKPGVL
ncbi:hypothetical protein [Pseudomonas aeruginosa]